jgi:hypothetical protein
MAKRKFNAKKKTRNLNRKKAAAPYQTKHHLVAQFSAGVLSGAYMRHPEFENLTFLLSNEQIGRLERRLSKKLHSKSREMISGIFLRTIEDATIRQRMPSTKDIENVFAKIASDATTILGSLSELKRRITFPNVRFGDPINAKQRQQFLTAEQVAAYYLARTVETPELYLDLIP